ncbi:MAG: hypothetical protein KKD63_16745 [Proteobacteria bacterium]|nr:hypothetical protein [Desulfobulbaceae bacterium]MBU4154521.1 hypothetical protein [Pseudomonadota bacterium]
MSGKKGFRLQIWDLSPNKAISSKGYLVDVNDDCFFDRNIVEEAKRRMNEYNKNIRFQLLSPDNKTAHYLCTESDFSNLDFT